MDVPCEICGLAPPHSLRPGWVTALWHLEIAGYLSSAEQRGEMDATDVADAIALLERLPVSVDAETGGRALTDTLALARQHNLSVYDAASLELALRRSATLATLKSSLRGAARKQKIAIWPER